MLIALSSTLDKNAATLARLTGREKIVQHLRDYPTAARESTSDSDYREIASDALSQNKRRRVEYKREICITNRRVSTDGAAPLAAMPQYGPRILTRSRLVTRAEVGCCARASRRFTPRALPPPSECISACKRGRCEVTDDSYVPNGEGLITRRLNSLTRRRASRCVRLLSHDILASSER